MLQALIQQLGNNFNEIKSVVSYSFEQIQASHVVFGRACGAALTTPNMLRQATAYDINEPTTKARTDKSRVKQSGPRQNGRRTISNETRPSSTTRHLPGTEQPRPKQCRPNEQSRTDQTR